MRISCPKCPSSSSLKPTTLLERLVAYHCDRCDGNYLSSSHYYKWKDGLSETLPEKDGYDTALVSNDHFDALICPECQRIMLKYRVGHDIPFKIDFCRNCNGVWLDANEWEILKSKNLHDELNHIFTDSWQSNARKREIDEQLESLFRNRIGEERYAKVKELKTWLATTNFKSEIIAYLQEDKSD